MAKLTIGQASHVNVLLAFLLGEEGAPRFADERVEEACTALAEDAYAALHAGWGGSNVRAAFRCFSAISVRRQRGA